MAHTMDTHQKPSLRESLISTLVGKQLDQIPAPAAVLDRAVMRRNCSQMLACCSALGVMFRPHVKTHKTIEVTRMQVGDVTKNVNIIVSTIAEAEHIMPYLRNCSMEGKVVNVLYGIPLAPSQIHRLVKLGKELGPDSISVMIDHLAQLPPLQAFREATGFNAHIFVKVDVGYGRAGLPPRSNELRTLLRAVAEVATSDGFIHFSGLYSHAGHSYGVSSEAAAMKHLSDEIDGLIEAASLAAEVEIGSPESIGGRRKYVLSVGATPSATSIQNLITDTRTDWESDAEHSRLRKCIEHAKEHNSIELHAGVYPILDMQQLATQASPSASMFPSMDARQRIMQSDIALTILAEIVSTYTNRTPEEALVAAGSLALGREPCKSYGGWGVVSNWNMLSVMPSERSGWEVARISQEHGILQKTSDHAPTLPVGTKVRIWPNHACVAGAGFDFYLVVDSDLSGQEDMVVDIYMRCRGW